MLRKLLICFILLIFAFTFLIAQPEIRWDASNLVLNVDWGMKGTFIAIATRSEGVKMVDAVTGQVSETIPFAETGTIWGAALSPDETQLSTVGNDPTVKIWNTATGELEYSLEGHFFGPNAASWGMNSTLLATGSYGGYPDNVRIWDVTSQQTLFTIPLGDDSPRLALNSDNKLAISVVTKLEIWDVASQQMLVRKVDSGLRQSIEWSDDNRHLLIANMQILAEGEVYSIEIWDTETMEIVREFKDFPYQLTSATWNPDETKILSTDVMGTVRITDSVTGESAVIFQSDQLILSADWSPFGGQVAVGVAVGADAQPARGVVTRDSIPGLAIVVPFASFEQLETLGEACGITGLTRANVAKVVAKDDACGRDFNAVAEALMAQE
jgi:WD40 repeat protein